MRIKRCWLPCLGMLLVTLPAPAATPGFDAAAFDAAVAKVMQDWRVPGLAVAVVNRDGVIHLRGYGTREWGRDQPVDADTIFAVGSNGKSFTSVLLGALVDQQRLRLNDPIGRYLPAFRMADPYATAHVTFEDALGHLSGLPEQSGLTAWYLFGLDRREMIALVAGMPLATSLRGGFAYNNTMFTVAGEAAAALTGLDYDEAIRRYLTTPLGLSRTTTTLAITRTDANVARPHAFAAGVPVPVPYHDVTGAAPAGSANSTARDMARYVRMWLNDGSLDGTRVLAPETAAAVQRLRRTLAPGEMPHIRQLFGALVDPALAQDLLSLA
ncbi:MAG: beta-lactamase family protein [Gammaproteobacteria bacterium]|nr:beta-lactamase family protein [Gammaproteobacteria bacterium]